MLTREEVVRVMQGPRDGWERWFNALPVTEYLNLARVLRELKTGAQGLGCMPASAVQDLAKAVPDQLVRDIVADNRHGVSQPGWLKPESGEPVKRGDGWQKPQPYSVPGLKYVDQLCDVQDAIDRRDLVKKLGG